MEAVAAIPKRLRRSYDDEGRVKSKEAVAAIPKRLRRPEARIQKLGVVRSSRRDSKETEAELA